MHQFTRMCFILACLVGLWAGQAQLVLAKPVNYPAPPIAIQQPNQLSKANTQASSLTDLEGKVVYVDFWASWCVPCRRSFPWMNQMQQQYGDELVILAINLDQEPELAQQFLMDNPSAFHVEFNPSGELAQAYQVIGMPSSYLIDKRGQVRFAHTGFFIKQIANYEHSIAQLIAE
ncbi:MAG: TlpA disulfide reductase family protein [Glaciecola sp.]|jgi:thiol-disulfide isomerase/thioredoxin|nr:TlpA disulfide reductase family protein [Glaciecola sp.]MDG2099276.1 TlpA disulfide reductase family protein [Glaciecola sp.]